jgi:mRNA interferase MazF
MSDSYQKGDVLVVDYGEPYFSAVGREIAYTRNAVVLTCFEHIGLALVLPTTTKEAEASYPTTVRLAAGTGNLRETSYVLLHQLRVVSHKRVRQKVGRLDDVAIKKIDAALAFMLGFEI